MKTVLIAMLAVAAACHTQEERTPAPMHVDEEPPAPPAPPPSRMSEAAGSGMATILREPNHAHAGRLRIIGAAKAEEQRFKSADLIVGYPVEGAPRELSPDDARALGKLILDDRSYDTSDTVQRCANDVMHGARFAVGDAIVEFALGRPCAQAFVIFHTEGGIRTEFGRMTQDAVTAVANIVDATR